MVPPQYPQAAYPQSAYAQAPYAQAAYPQAAPPPPPYPAPYVPAAAPVPGAAGSYEASSSSGQGPKIALMIAGGGVALALVISVVVLSLTANRGKTNPTTSPAAGGGPGSSQSSGSSGSPSASPLGTGRHDVIAADTAGGWPRDSAGERELASTINSQKTTLRNATGGRLTKVVSAFYKDTRASSRTGLPAGVVFLGGTGPLGDPAAFVSSFRGAASSSGTVTEVDPGAGGGRAVCAEANSGSTSIAFCAWATTDSFGEIVSTTPGRSAGSVASQMRRMRPDLEFVK